jgi:hypothetical protein
MITPYLEKLIWDGKAVFTSKVIGAAGLSILEVKDNEMIIILDFNTYHFLDNYPGRDEADSLDLFNMIKQPVYNIMFDSKSSRFSYCCRPYVIPTGIDMGGEIGYIQTAMIFGESAFNTYQVHENNVHIRIFKTNDINTWAITNGNPPAPANEQPSPLGYNTSQTNWDINFNGVDRNYLPLNANGTLTPAFGMPAGYRDEFRDNVDLDTMLSNPVGHLTRLSNLQYPILNIHYVKISDLSLCKNLHGNL